MKLLAVALWAALSGHVAAELYLDWDRMSYRPTSERPKPSTEPKGPFAKEADYVRKPERGRRTAWWQSKAHKHQQSAYHRTSRAQTESTRRYGRRVLDPHEAAARLAPDELESLDARKFRQSEERRLAREEAAAHQLRQKRPGSPIEVVQSAEQGLRTGLGKAVGKATKAKAEFVQGGAKGFVENGAKQFVQNGAKRRKLNPRPLKA